MAKLRTRYICQQCGAEHAQWLGQCKQCKEWNSLVEEVVDRTAEKRGIPTDLRSGPSAPIPIHAITAEQGPRHSTHDEELDRVLGGGLVPGSITLIGGEPGIGKSTLLLQTALRVRGRSTLYVSGEESEAQIRMRADRLSAGKPTQLEGSALLILTETNLQRIIDGISKVKPQLLIIDSIQTLYSSNLDPSPGSVGQVRECASELMRVAKSTNIPVILIGHITKEGHLAGPKVLEHMVDCVLQFEGDRDHAYRLLRPLKNRFGSTNELGIYEMHGEGLNPVTDPSQVMLGDRGDRPSGVCVAASMEGHRPMLIEVQALVSSAVYGTPQRSATGFDLRRMNMLLAVLEKRCGFRLGSKDVFLNLAGGFRVEEPAIDLAVVCAVLSSDADIPVPVDSAFCGEVGLTGEIRPVPRMDQRIAEAQKLGFKKFFLPKGSKGATPSKGLRLLPVARVDDVLRDLFG